MKVLYILRSEPDDNRQKMMDLAGEGKEVMVLRLYEGHVDYDKFVDMLFDHDRVVTMT